MVNGRSSKGKGTNFSNLLLFSRPKSCLVIYPRIKIHLVISRENSPLALCLLLRFFEDLKDMLGFTPYRCYYYLWKYITPILLLILMAASFIQMIMTPTSYNAWIREEVSKHLGPRSPGASLPESWNQLKADEGSKSMSVQASFNLRTINRMCSLPLIQRRVWSRREEAGATVSMRDTRGGGSLPHLIKHSDLDGEGIHPTSKNTI